MTTAAPPVQAINKLASIETELNHMFLEREQAIREILVCLLAKHHCVLIGDPGTGKSALIEEMCRRVTNAQGTGLKYFPYLMTRFTNMDEIFGPVSFDGIKQSTYERVLAGRLAEAEVAFLDEYWKANSAVLNATLKVLNERVFDNGIYQIRVPLMCVFAASNELPEGNDLAAARDRFLLTHFVKHLSRSNRELLMLRKAKLEADPWDDPKTMMDRSELEALQSYITTLPFSRSAVTAKMAIVDDLSRQGIMIGERRDGQCQMLMQAHALSDGRDMVNEDDLAILYDAFWQEPSQQATAVRAVNQHSNPTNAKASELKDQADEIYKQALQQLQTLTQPTQKGQRTMAAAEAAGKLDTIKTDLEKLQRQAATAKMNTRRVDQALASVTTQHQEVLKAVGFKL